jgi:hypothetical protein
VCYTFPLETAHLPSVVAVVRHLRTALVAALSGGLGATLATGLRLADGRYALVGAVGSAAVLGVSLVVEAVRRMDDPIARAQMAALQEQVTGLRAQVTELEILIAALKSSADIAIRSSRSDLGVGAADRTGNPARSVVT